MFVKNKYQNYKKGEIIIGAKSLIGSGSIILPNVKISKNTLIGALSLINKNILKPGTYSGIPVKKVKNKVIIIAEGINHNGKLSIAKRLIEEASKSGADYVKFQTYDLEKIIIKNTKATLYQRKT